MPEPSLAIAFPELKARVSVHMGWGQGADYSDTAWTTAQAFDIAGIVASGLRQFYHPPPIEGQETTYEWSFLRPWVSLTLAADAYTVLLPDDFGGLEGRITVSVSGESQFLPVPVVADVRQRRAEAPDTTGRPEYAAIEVVRGTSADAGQRHTLAVWPTADQAYTLQFQYYVNGDYLSTAFPYHLGTAAHAETILESCLAIAEQRLDDVPGLHTMKFKERLLASINIDRKMKPQYLGKNLDRSDGAEVWDPRWSQYRVTFSGTQYP